MTVEGGFQIPHCTMCPCATWRTSLQKHNYESCRFRVPHPMVLLKRNGTAGWYCPAHDGDWLGEHK